jgi:hypothetical protein
MGKMLNPFDKEFKGWETNSMGTLFKILLKPFFLKNLKNMTINTFCKISCFGITLMWYNCSTHENKKNTNVVEQEPVVVNLSGDPSKDPIGWSKTDSVKIKLDSTLSHQSAGFACDSALAIDYTGFEGEHIFLPLNHKGHWIRSIKQKKRLTSQQIKRIHAILGDSNSFKKPMHVMCYMPRLGLVFFRKDTVIAQSAICIGCAGLESSARLGSETFHDEVMHSNVFNLKTLRKWEQICQELRFSDCKQWSDLKDQDE